MARVETFGTLCHLMTNVKSDSCVNNCRQPDTNELIKQSYLQVVVFSFD